MHLVHKISGRFILYISILNIIIILITTGLSGLYNFSSYFKPFEKGSLPLIKENAERENNILIEEQLRWLIKAGTFSYAGLFSRGKAVTQKGSLENKMVTSRRYLLDKDKELELVIRTPFKTILKSSFLKSLPVFISLILLVLGSALLFNKLYNQLISKPLHKVVDYLRDFDLIEQGQRLNLNEIDRIGDGDRELNSLASSINEIGINMQCTFLFLKETNDKLIAEIEERKRVEERLRKSEERYKSLVERTSDWLWELDENSNFTYASPRIKDLLGYNPEELLGKSPFFLMSKEEAKKVNEVYSPYLEKQRPFYCMINVNLHRDGHEVILESSGEPIFDSEGNFKGYRGIDRDVTAKKMAEEEVTRAEAFLRNIIESMPSALFTINYEGVITRLNRKAEEIIGVSEEQVVGNEIVKILPYFNRYKEIFIKIKKENEPVLYHYESFTELKERYFDVSFYPLTTNGMEGIAIRMDDVTDQEKVERQLIQSHKMESIGVLAGGLAHDFNNVLAGIITTVSILKYEISENSLKPEGLEEYIDTIERAGERAAAIVKQLLAISRKNKTNFTTLDLNRAINNVLEICRNSFDKTITIQSKLYPEPALIRSEQTQVEQIILNLCINGYHAMTIMRESTATAGGILSLQVERFTADARFCQAHVEAEERDYYRLKLQDNGVGMDDETISHIFEPFFTTKEKEKGTGLGLSMAYSLIKEHNGFITIYSEPGRGTTVNLFIPCIDGEAIPHKSTPLPKAESRIQSGSILIVDDEEIVRSLASKILERKGYSTLKAAEGREGLAIFGEHCKNISLVLLDISMPELSGKEIFIEMCKIDPNVKVIICSGLEQDSRVQDLKTMGIKGFLQKPYNMQQLLDIVNKVIEED